MDITFAGITFPRGQMVASKRFLRDVQRSASQKARIAVKAEKDVVAYSWGTILGTQAHLITSTLINNTIANLTYYDVTKDETITMRAFWEGDLPLQFVYDGGDLSEQLHQGLSVVFVEV